MGETPLDAPAIARALALVAARRDDLAELYLERRLEAELPPGGDGAAGFRLRRESGLAARLVRDGSAWHATRDAIDARALADALRSVARSLPPALPEPAGFGWGEPELAAPFAEMAAFPARLERALRALLVGFPLRLTVRWHASERRIVSPRTATGIEREQFASLDAATPWGRAGALAVGLDDAAAGRFAARLQALFRAREAPPPAAGHPPLLLSPAAAAVALHECVAHALEADLLAESGNPVAADGVELGGRAIDVLDDPGAAPPGVARAFDDEGAPTVRRWLLRGGRIAEPIADARSCRRWPELLPGSGFRADRHAPPLPRTHHLELLAGEADLERLRSLAEGGLEITAVRSGALDPVRGSFVLDVPGARRIVGGAPGEAVGPFRIRGRVASLLEGVVELGAARESEGAGWCAKGGQRRAVWATVPAVVVAGLEVTP